MKLINIRSLLCVVAAANSFFVGINALEDAPTEDAAVGTPADEEPMNAGTKKIILDIQVLPDDMEEEAILDKLDVDNGNLRRRRKLLGCASDMVLLCKHYDCEGGSVHVGPGRYVSMPWEIGNDALSRAFIPAGYSIEYYEHDWLGGWSNTVGSGDTCIDLYMRGHEDAVSSFVIHKL